MGDVTVLLQAARRGEDLAVGSIFELLYPELKRIAHAQLRYRDERMLMETGVLVNEAYLRLLGQQRLSAAERGPFLAYAARVMRSVVIDTVREQQAQRRGGGPGAQVTLNTAALQDMLPSSESEIMQVHEALLELQQIDARLAQVVELRYFGGLNNEEIGDSLGLTSRTVERDWQKARAFLFDAMQGG